MALEIDHASASGDADSLIEHARRQMQTAQRLQPVEIPDDFPTDRFPGYTVVANVSEGGQGAIYEAFEHTTRRRVAIKVLRSGPFSAASERIRFEREVRILGRLQHPHIVTIHTSGTTERQPYFVMDFIDGRPLDEFVQDEDLSVTDVLTLFLKIAGAVDAAHLHGVTHRDLKPANILVDTQGQPHVLDFGLAKTSDGPTSGVTVTTPGQFVGSLPWAAPEQLRDDPGDVDLRTDVYGLGLVLYFMLTQSLPFDRYGIARDVMDSILVGTHAPPSRFGLGIDDELDTIVLKCLSVAPERRYQMAGEVARDVERYMAGDPIEAKRDSPTYLLRKTIRRHRTVATLGAALLLMGFAYTATVSVLYGRAVRSENVARQRTIAAHEQYRLARESLEFLINDALERLDKVPGTSHAKQDLLRGAYRRLTLLASEHSDDPAFRMDLVHTHHQLGNLAVRLAKYDEARQHFESELQLRKTFSEDVSELPDNVSALSINHVVLGDIAQRQGDLKLCAFHYKTALEIDERLVRANPKSARFRDNLGWSYDRLGALALKRGHVTIAEEYYRRSLELTTALAAEQPDNANRLRALASSHGRLSEIAAGRNDWPAAVAHLEEGTHVVRRILSLQPANTEAMILQTNSLCTLAYDMTKADAAASSRNILAEAETLADSLVELEPRLPASHWARARVGFQSMDAASRYGDRGSTVEYARRTLAAISDFEEVASTNEEIVYMKAAVHRQLWSSYAANGEPQAAEAECTQALTLLDRAFDARIDSVKLRVLHVTLLHETVPTDSRTKTRINTSADRMVQLAIGGDPYVQIQVGRVCSDIAEHELAVAALQRASDALTAVGRPFPDDARRLLSESRAALARP